MNVNLDSRAFRFNHKIAPVSDMYVRNNRCFYIQPCLYLSVAVMKNVAHMCIESLTRKGMVDIQTLRTIQGEMLT